MRKFVLGLGAQKAGTTWLYNQLEKVDGFKKPPTKEMHIFDALYIPQCRNFGKQLENRFAEQLGKGRKHYQKLPVTKRFQMYLDEKEYFRYFDRSINEDEFSSDISPTYSGLDEGVLNKIKQEFDRRKIDLRVVFLMREPVCRLESAVKMACRGAGKIGSVSAQEIIKKMQNSCGSDADRLRSNYHETVARMRNCFDPDQMYLGFYETMFTPEEQSRLANFIGIDVKLFDTQKKFNVTKETFKYAESDLIALRGNYGDVYDFVYSDLGLSSGIWDKAIGKITS